MNYTQNSQTRARPRHTHTHTHTHTLTFRQRIHHDQTQHCSRHAKCTCCRCDVACTRSLPRCPRDLVDRRRRFSRTCCWQQRRCSPQRSRTWGRQGNAFDRKSGRGWGEIPTGTRTFLTGSCRSRSLGCSLPPFCTSYLRVCGEGRSSCPRLSGSLVCMHRFLRRRGYRRQPRCSPRPLSTCCPRACAVCRM